MDPLAAVDAVQNFNLLPSFISLKSIRDDEKLFLASGASLQEIVTQKQSDSTLIFVHFYCKNAQKTQGLLMDFFWTFTFLIWCQKFDI